ncbi:hypothetical protein [Oribacterium sp. WCC10]|uniref:hypothetical protein n=1 Tax=Oribacterium sp. WCC10 TaxID=1855343 RepID=UPI0008EEAD8E|nr:hypothetical protein [Oribacterium sp. WCC10]SFG56046.1 hypothetical protein SAMN05216356_11315 [Oribacterium sp. WCC10]
MNLPIAIGIIIFLAVGTVFIFKNGVRMDKLTPEEQETIIKSRCTACRMSRYCNESKTGNCKSRTVKDLK